jgi:hypothetical protein
MSNRRNFSCEFPVVLHATDENWEITVTRFPAFDRITVRLKSPDTMVQSLCESHSDGRACTRLTAECTDRSPVPSQSDIVRATPSPPSETGSSLPDAQVTPFHFAYHSRTGVALESVDGWSDYSGSYDSQSGLPTT